MRGVRDLKLGSFLNQYGVDLVFVSEISELFLDRIFRKSRLRIFLSRFVRLFRRLLQVEELFGNLTRDKGSRRGVFFKAALFDRSNVLIRFDRRSRIFEFVCWIIRGLTLSRLKSLRRMFF